MQSHLEWPAELGAIEIGYPAGDGSIGASFSKNVSFSCHPTCIDMQHSFSTRTSDSSLLGAYDLHEPQAIAEERPPAIM
jgi:hypothetical protein